MIDYKKIEEEFNSLNKEDQWKWLLSIEFKDKIQITIDNDATDITFIGEDDGPMLSFKSDIGNRLGVNYLLQALGFNVENC